MIYDHISYFEELAGKLLKVSHSETNKHFFSATTFLQLEGLITSLSVAQYPAIIAIDKKDGRFIDQLSSNLIDVQFYQVLILMPSVDMSSSNRNAVMNTCQSIFRSIVSKMTADKLTDCKLPMDQELSGLRNFDRNEIVYNSLGPIFDNLFGIEFSFTLPTVYDTKYDANEWQS
ncbi:MAG: hypothetical protein K0B15_11820 [Lentimicrobium sp.]|nr:hypothetical protein [Lentimicrobium sp.]